MSELEFRVLGLVVICADGATVPLPFGGKPRALLAALLLRPNRPVSRDVLLDALWPATQPASAAHALEVHVSRTRKALDAAGLGERLRTVPGGYVLDVRSGELDLERFQQLSQDGRDALAGGDAARALLSFDEALALWRDDPLPELLDEPHARIESDRLREQRLETGEARLDAMLARGRHVAATAELQAHVDAHPLRERPRALLMLALYRSGRQADALEAYRQARRTLLDEFGLEPSAELRELEQAVLRQDPSLSAPAPDAAPRPRSTLPRPAAPLRGREEDVVAVAALLAESRLVTLVCPGGIGKTRLALAAADAAGNSSSVSWIPLEATTDLALVSSAIAQGIGAAGQDPGDALGDADALLVLDNLEQISDAGLPIAELLRALSARARARDEP